MLSSLLLLVLSPTHHRTVPNEGKMMVAHIQQNAKAGAMAAIQHNYDAWTQAYMKQDIDGLDALLAPDFVMYVANGQKRDRMDFLGSIMRGFGMGQVVTHFTVRIEKLVATKDGWMATISERAQVGEGKFGQITEDGWRHSSDGTWLVTSTRLVKRLER